MTRIIAGTARGQQLQVPAGKLTRPTTDRVRESLFSRLASWASSAGGPAETALTGLAFCDLYAGSGAVGLEAASRGAAPVTLVESAAKASEIIAANAAKTRLSVDLRTQSVQSWLAETSPLRYDIVWADPPYDLDAASVRQLIQAITHTRLASNGLIVFERATRSEAPIWPDGTDSWSATYGETTLHFGQ